MTITSIKKLKPLISTSVATYGLNLKDTKGLKVALTDKDNKVGFTPSQADEFMQHYKLIDQQQNVPYNGFAAAVFEDLATGKHIIAMRGTETPIFPNQTWLDLVVADGSIGVNGFANTQAAEMYRYSTAHVELKGKLKSTKAVNFSARQIRHSPTSKPSASSTFTHSSSSELSCAN